MIFRFSIDSMNVCVKYHDMSIVNNLKKKISYIMVIQHCGSHGLKKIGCAMHYLVFVFYLLFS